MKTIEINSDKYYLPTSLKETTTSKFIEVIKLAEDAKLGNIERAGKILKVLTGIPDDVFNELGAGFTMQLFGELDFLFEDIEKEIEPISFIKINDENYYVNALDKSLFKEFAYYDALSVHIQRVEERYPHQCAILVRKQGENFDDIENIYEERVKMFKELDFHTVKSIAGFFLLKEKKYKTDLKTYSTLQEMQQVLTASLEEISAKNMAGKLRLSTWQKIQLKYLKSLILKPTKS